MNNRDIERKKKKRLRTGRISAHHEGTKTTPQVIVCGCLPVTTRVVVRLFWRSTVAAQIVHSRS